MPDLQDTRKYDNLLSALFILISGDAKAFFPLRPGPGGQKEELIIITSH
jgi:hypothetical protein